MHVKAKQIAFLGLLAAVTILCIVFAAVFETSSLFLLAAAAFCVGIGIRETGLSLGIGFYIVCILLGVLLAPNKLYVITFSVLAFYILFRELIYEILTKKKTVVLNKTFYWIAKFLCFNLFYLLVLFVFPKLIYSGTLSPIYILLFMLVGQIGWFVFDQAYDYFQLKIWGKYRNKFSILN